MSDPDTPPPVATPATSRISDRAALEAALAGAAGLLVGRLLLGRGAGLLAGGAAIAARLLKDAAAPALAPAESAPPQQALPAESGALPQTATTPQAEDMAVEEAVLEVAEEEGGPDHGGAESAAAPVHAPSPTGSHPGVTTAPPETTGRGAVPEAASNPFANLFREADRATAVESTVTRPTAAGAIIEEKAGAPGLTLPPLPAFPQRTEASPEETVPVAASKESGVTPEQVLPDFPGMVAEMPHPEEIWKMAARESAPVPAVANLETGPQGETASAVGVAPPADTSPFLAFTPPPSLAQRQAWVVPSDKSNPFAALAEVPATPPAPPAPLAPTADAATVAPAVSIAQAMPPVIPVEAGVSPADSEAPVLEIPPLEPPTGPPEGFGIADGGAAKTSTLAESPKKTADLPVISLKAPSPPPHVALEVKAVVEETIFTPSGQGSVAPQEWLPESSTASVPAAPSPMRTSGSTAKIWLLLLLLIAAALAIWYWKNGSGKAERNPEVPSRSAQPTVTAPPAPQPTPAETVPGPKPNPSPASPALPADPASAPPKAAAPTAVSTPPEAKPAPSAPEAVVYGEPTPGVPQEFPPGSPDAQARGILEKLLAAREADDLTALVLRPQEAVRRIPAYYPDGELHPSPWRRILFDSADQIPNSPFKARIFRVVTDTVPLGFPVAVEDTQDGPRIDFDAFVQCRDRLLDAFIANPALLPGRFLVVLRRGHYFGDDLTAAEQEQLVCFEVSSPNLSSTKYPVFVRKNTELGKLALRRFVWDRNFTPVVELTHADGHVLISAIVQETWRSPAP